MAVAVITMIIGMGRWEPDARGRLEEAAMELYLARGFEQTTVADIASRAGLTERTFFRHFADKREVLFGGAGVLNALLVDRVASAPSSLCAMDAVASALDAAGAMFEPNRARARQRQTVIDANPVLLERELIKLASLATAMAGALRERGVGEPAAALSAEAGVAVFRVAFDRWVRTGSEGGGSGSSAGTAAAEDHTFQELLRDSLAQLRAVTAAD